MSIYMGLLKNIYIGLLKNVLKIVFNKTFLKIYINYKE